MFGRKALFLHSIMAVYRLVIALHRQMALNSNVIYLLFDCKYKTILLKVKNKIKQKCSILTIIKT